MSAQETPPAAKTEAKGKQATCPTLGIAFQNINKYPRGTINARPRANIHKQTQGKTNLKMSF